MSCIKINVVDKKPKLSDFKSFKDYEKKWDYKELSEDDLMIKLWWSKMTTKNNDSRGGSNAKHYD